MIERTIRIESGTNSDGLRLSIQDDTSGLTFVELLLTPEQIWVMLNGGHQTLTGKGGDRLDRFGKTMVNDRFEVPASVIKPWEVTKMDSGGAEEIAADWAKAEHPDWDSYEPRRTNRGTMNVIVRKWVTDDGVVGR
jgi:hypothetical protein